MLWGSSSLALPILSVCPPSEHSPIEIIANHRRKLTYAYEICRRGKLNVLYALIFAFTTAQHLFGDRERQLKQLESGREIARHLGGKDRQDQVGQLPLGMWYNIKLRGESLMSWASFLTAQTITASMAALTMRRPLRWPPSATCNVSSKSLRTANHTSHLVAGPCNFP